MDGSKILERVRKIYHKNKEILVVDYSGCRGESMIAVFEQAKALAVAEDQHLVVLNIFNNKSYVSSGFMKHIKQNLPSVERLIDKQAIIGLSPVQEWILKGMNLWYERKVYSFDTEEEALDFLANDQPSIGNLGVT